MITNTQKSELQRIDGDLAKTIKKKGMYGETFSDILRRLLHQQKVVKTVKSKIEDKV